MSEIVTWLRVDPNGVLQVPPELLRYAGLTGEEPVCVAASDEGFEILSRRAALKRANAIARRFVPEGVSVVDELIAERRREAALENDDV